MGSAVLQSRNLPKLLVVIGRAPRTRRARKMDRLSFRNIRNKFHVVTDDPPSKDIIENPLLQVEVRTY